FKSSGVATSLTYLLCILLFVVFPLGVAFVLSVFMNTSEAARCLMLTTLMVHPGASLASILVDEVDFNAVRLLPATLPLYSALAGLFFLGAEARLSALVAQRWRHWHLVFVLLLIVLVAVGYIIAGPVIDLCRP
ncbi:MAG: hypothetical protein M3220_14905, partial [Chloroflexota bacterium]|nr:hypothetical protein [Chloroflexota bacterium]